MSESKELPQPSEAVNSEISRILLRLVMLANRKLQTVQTVSFYNFPVKQNLNTVAMPSHSQVPLCLIHWFYSPKRNSPFLDRTLIFHNLTRSGYLFMPRTVCILILAFFHAFALSEEMHCFVSEQGLTMYFLL